MLDINFIRENIQKVKRDTQRKNLDPGLVDKLLKADDEYRELLQKVENLRAERNRLGKEDRKKGKEIKIQLKELEPRLRDAKVKVRDLQMQIPNLISEQTPEGKDESDNVVIRKWGEIPKFDFEPRDHVQIGEDLDLIDIPTSAVISGPRFNYLKNEAVLIQFAIIQWVLQTLTNQKLIKELCQQVGNEHFQPFVPVVPPVIIKSEVAKKMDRFDPIEDRYYLEEDDSLLVGSAEHSLGPMYMGKILKEEVLPIRLIGYSTAFRREAGSYGKDTRGILRRHQFDKLEMEVFSTAESGQKEQDLVVAIQEYLVKKLRLPYQVVEICTGDMGKPDYRQIDIEIWMPGQNKYRETHTSDYMTDYQARRLGTKYKTKEGKVKYVHMNDATAFAIGRILIAILENYQQRDGSVLVPEVLRDWVGKESISPRKT